MIHIFSLPLRFFINTIQLLRRTLYKIGVLRSDELSGYVLSVGNVEFGGTGKTPLVIYLVESLVSKGFRPVVLTRGYGSSLKRNQFAVMRGGKVVFGHKLESCDEPKLISKKNPNVPIVVGRKRKEAASKFLNFDDKYNPTHWILDDGFQHLSIKRDFDICLVTGDFFFSKYLTRPFSREFVFTKDNADLTLLTKTNKKQNGISHCNFEIEGVFHAVSNKPLEVHKKISLFAGIAKPLFLKNQLVELDYIVTHQLFIDDHALVSKKSFVDLVQKGLPIVMSEKDFFRQESFFSNSRFDIYLVRQNVRVDDALFQSIFEFVNA